MKQNRKITKFLFTVTIIVLLMVCITGAALADDETHLSNLNSQTQENTTSNTESKLSFPDFSFSTASETDLKEYEKGFAEGYFATWSEEVNESTDENSIASSAESGDGAELKDGFASTLNEAEKTGESSGTSDTGFGDGTDIENSFVSTLNDAEYEYTEEPSKAYNAGYNDGKEFGNGLNAALNGDENLGEYSNVYKLGYEAGLYIISSGDNSDDKGLDMYYGAVYAGFTILSHIEEGQIVYQENAIKEEDAFPASNEEGYGLENSNEGISDSTENSNAIWLYISIASIVIILLAVVALLLLIKSKKRKSARDNGNTANQVDKAEVGFITNIGSRPNQQDNLGVFPTGDGILAVVADGMGGLSDGDKVSGKIISTAKFDAAQITESDDSTIYRIIAHCNQEVCRMLSKSTGAKSGSTMLTVLAEEGRMRWATVGDSRIYLYRNGVLLQLNREHIYRRELLFRAINGKMGFAEAMNDPQNSRLTSYIGMGELKHVDGNLKPTRLRHDDCVLLMTDGVFNAMSESEMASILRTGLNAQDAAAEIEKRVLQKQVPNQDNFSCVILKF